MNIKLLTEHHLELFLSLKRGYTGLSESTLVKMPHCWKSHIYEPAHEILASIAYTPKAHLNTHTDVFSKERGLQFGLSLHLYPFIVYASSEGSGI